MFQLSGFYCRVEGCRGSLRVPLRVTIRVATRGTIGYFARVL